LCYLVVVAHVGIRKGGIINYNSTNIISTLQKHLIGNITRKFGLTRLNGKMLFGWDIEDQQKKLSSPTPSNIATFFGSNIP